MKFIVAFALILQLALASDVIVGTEANFNDLIKSDTLTLVEFYAPWCGHCKTLAPQWETAATELKGVATLVKVDATEEDALGKLYEVQGYPTIKIFDKEGAMSAYEGGRTSDDIVKFVKRRSGSATTALTKDTLADFTRENAISIVGYFEGENAEFAKFAEANRNDYTFGHVTAAADFDGEEANTVVVYKEHGAEKESAPFDDELLTFIKASSFPALGEIGPENYQSYLERKIPLAWMFLDPSADISEAAKAAVTKVAGDYKGKISFVWLSGVQYPQMPQKLGLPSKPEDFPNMAIEELESGDKFVFKGDVSDVEALTAWIKEYATGSITASVNTEERPDPDTVDGLTTLVGSSFKEIVYDETKDVLIEFYAPWCGHCKSLAPKFKALGAKTASAENIIVGMIDATANDFPKADFDVKGFPTIYLKQAGADGKILAFEGDRSTKGMLDFLKEKATNADQLKNVDASEGDNDEL